MIKLKTDKNTNEIQVALAIHDFDFTLEIPGI
jgi:hypothetical protein